MGKRLMCVVAHPDDECFAFGGALALASDRGIQSYVVCLTDGQAATNRGIADSGDELGKIRRQEFAASCRVLGVTDCELLGYRDGQLESIRFSEASGRLVERMRRFRPDDYLRRRRRDERPRGSHAGVGPDYGSISLVRANPSLSRTRRGTSAEAAFLRDDRCTSAWKAISQPDALECGTGCSQREREKDGGVPPTCLAGSPDGAKPRIL